jgi:hypothetical protein
MLLPTLSVSLTRSTIQRGMLLWEEILALMLRTRQNTLYIFTWDKLLFCSSRVASKLMGSYLLLDSSDHDDADIQISLYRVELLNNISE